MMHYKKHALVIGGTGMLANVCVDLAYKGYFVSVIGRTQSKFQQLILSSPDESIFPLVVNYNTGDVLDEVENAISKRGPFDLIVSWTPNYDVLERICELNRGTDEFRLFHVKGSRRYFDDEPVCIPDNCSYRKVFLGYIIEDDSSRWLTNDEIAGGVIIHIETDRIDGIIGQIHPYEARPR